MDVYNPPVSVLAKLGSAVVHAQEMLGPKGHQFDRTALDAIMADPEVCTWLELAGDVALITLKR